MMMQTTKEKTLERIESAIDMMCEGSEKASRPMEMSEQEIDDLLDLAMIYHDITVSREIADCYLLEIAKNYVQNDTEKTVKF